MKLSVSVPDDLWEAVSGIDGSASQVVQESLRLLAERRRRDFPTIGESHYADDGDLELREAVDKLTAEAAALRGTGYSIGVELSMSLPWLTLDVLPAGAALLRQLRAWQSGFDADPPVDDLPEDFRGALINLLIQSEEGLDDSENVVWLPTLFEGIVAGVEETHDAVRRRLHAAVGTPDGRYGS